MRYHIILILSFFTTFCSSSNEFNNIAVKTSGSSNELQDKSEDNEEEEEITAVPPTIISGAYLACNMIEKDESSKEISSSCSLQKESKTLVIPDLIESDFEVKNGDKQLALTSFSYLGYGYYQISFKQVDDDKITIGIKSVSGGKIDATQNQDLVIDLVTDESGTEQKDVIEEPNETTEIQTPTTEPLTETRRPKLNCKNIGIPGTWIRVPGNPNYQTNDFCVMKYEAKEENGTPVSVAGELPWVDIKQSEAIEACASLGRNFHLISNREWMSIANNIINIDENWTGGTRGTGKIFQGNSDSDSDAPCAADIDDLNAFAGEDCEISASSDNPEQRRTHKIYNARIIWDLAGNVWEWTSNTILPSSKPSPYVDDYLEYTEPLIFSDPDFPLRALIPQLVINNQWNSEQGLGQYYPGLENEGGAIRRGGDFGTAKGGIFSARLSNDDNENREDIGFRCVRRIPQ